MKTALDVHRELLAREVRHEMVRVRGRLSSADDLPRMLDLTDGCAAVRCYTDPAVPPSAGRPLVAVLVPCGTTPDERALRAEVGIETLRPSTPDEVNAATDFAAGLVCPVGLPDAVRLVVDAAVAARHVLYTAAGEGGVALGIRARDLVAATGAEVLALAPVRQIDLDARTDVPGDSQASSQAGTVIALHDADPATRPPA